MTRGPQDEVTRRALETRYAEPFLHPDCGPESAGLLRRLVNYWPFLAVPLFLTIFFVSTGEVRRPIIVLWSFLVNSIISVCFGLSLVLTYALFTERLILRSRARVVRFLLHMVTLAGAVTAGAESSLALLGAIPGLERVVIPRAGLYRIGALVMGTLWLIEYTYGRLRARTRAVELREERSRREILRAQLEALQARTDPHFLFNSLNTVASLIEDDPVLAERVLEKLSDLFRYALDSGRRKSVRLVDEIDAVRQYLEVETLRLGERLRSSIVIEPGIEEVQVLPLLLQPLVENAVLHGIAPREGGGQVSIAARRHDAHIMLSVEDDGPGENGSRHRGTGTGLDTLRGRLELAYGGSAHLRTGIRAVRDGYRVELRLPLTLPAGDGGEGDGP